MLGVSSMVGANALYGIFQQKPSAVISKLRKMVSDVYSVAAQILNKQPEATREAAIASTAKFLGERPEIKDTHQEIIARLKDEIDIQRQNPWFENVLLAKTSVKTHVRRDSAVTPSPEIQTDGLKHDAKGVEAANGEHYKIAAATR